MIYNLFCNAVVRMQGKIELGGVHVTTFLKDESGRVKGSTRLIHGSQKGRFDPYLWIDELKASKRVKRLKR